MDRKEAQAEEELRYSEEMKNRAEMKQSLADNGVCHKNNQRKQTKREQEHSQNTRQYQLNVLIQSLLCLPRALFHFPKCAVC